MRELVAAIRAIWRSWNDGDPLDFRGEFYTHTLMTPFFNPGPNPFGTPKVFIAAVGPRMTRVVGEVADGLLVHPFTTEYYFRTETMPVLMAALSEAGRDRRDVEVSLSVMVATGVTDEELAKAIRSVKRQIAFCASTAAYRPVLATCGVRGRRPAWRNRCRHRTAYLRCRRPHRPLPHDCSRPGHPIADCRRPSGRGQPQALGVGSRGSPRTRSPITLR
jgi:probable F420-dependent oxidoreductase